MKMLMIFAVLFAVLVQSSAAPSPKDHEGSRRPLTGENLVLTDDDAAEMDNRLFMYQPMLTKRTDDPPASRSFTKPKSNSFKDLEREVVSSSEGFDPEPELAADSSKTDASAAVDDAVRSRYVDIAQNSREVRLIGPQQKEVEMKDDMATKVVVALENLQSEAKDVWEQVNEKLDKGWTDLKRAEVWGQMNEKLDKGWTDLKRAEVWGQVNDKLDKGWTDLKTMVEGVISPSVKKPN